LKNKQLRYFIFSIIIILKAQTTSFCQNNTGYLLVNQQFIGNKSVGTDELSSLLPQKPNKQFLFKLFRHKLAIYNWGLKKHKKDLEGKVYEGKINEAKKAFDEKSKNISENSPKYVKLKAKRDKVIEKYEKRISDGNWRMTKVGEPPVNFSEEIAQKNVEKLTKYLYNNGLFNAKVSFIADTNQNKKVTVTYIVNENKQYYIRSVKKITEDRKIEELITKNQNESKLTVNQPFSENNLTEERIRIETLLRNNGYYNFNRNLIKYKAIYLPTDLNGDVNIVMNISPPDYNENETLFEIGNVEFVVDASANQNRLVNPEISVDTIVNKNISYIFIGQKFSPTYLHKKIFLRPGEIYSQTNQFETQKALQNLDQFKFANPNFDTTGNKLNVRIYAIPLEKYQFTGEGGLNVFQGAPGPFVNASLKIRNIFGGLESLENTVRVGYEGQNGFVAKPAIDAGFNTAINIPQIFLPWSFSKLDKYNPRTQLGIGFNYADRSDYKRLNFKLGANYNWQVSQKNQFNFSLVDLNLINTPYLSPSFTNILDSLKINGNNLKESFVKSFVSSISGSYVYNDNFLGQSQKGKYLRLYGEFGGNLLNLAKNEEFKFVNKVLGNDLNYFKFIRFLADYRKFIPVGLNKSNIIAYRVNTGVAFSYNKSSEALPYEKYLFAGGSYSLRAWEPRRLGLNKNIAQSSDNKTLNYKQEQPGNLLIEGSIEYRFPIVKMYGQLNGAAFIDVGNVWTIKKAGVLAKESDFQAKNLFKQMAVGTGFGLRYDFTYFIIRLDAAVKVIEPLLESGNKYVLDDFFMKNKDASYKLNWNIGIGYPF
jgi:outer membrane protein assembly factor BamA